MSDEIKNAEKKYVIENQLSEKNKEYYRRLKSLISGYGKLTKEMYPSLSNAEYQELTKMICSTYGELKDLEREMTHSIVRSADNSYDNNETISIFFEGKDLHGQRYLDLDEQEKRLSLYQEHIKKFATNKKSVAAQQQPAPAQY